MGAHGDKGLTRRDSRVMTLRVTPAQDRLIRELARKEKLSAGEVLRIGLALLELAASNPASFAHFASLSEEDAEVVELVREIVKPVSQMELKLGR